MKTIQKKLILSVAAVIMLVITTVTTTFAWFSMNDAVWLDSFNLDIQSTDHLLISCDGKAYKSALTNDDSIKAINALRDNSNKITALSDIKLVPVTSFNGIDFKKQVVSYNSSNVQTVSYTTASKNDYLRLKLYFKMEATSGESDREYKLQLKTTRSDNGLNETKFTANNQTITLLNSLIKQGEGDTGKMKSGDELTVNPVNALRVSLIGASTVNSTLDKIMEFTDENDLGSYAIASDVLSQLNITDTKYFCSQNAMYTYFNNVHNNCLYPMNTIADNSNDVSTLLTKRLTDQKDISLGVFTYDQTQKDFNTIAIELAVWVEGYDADNLIGLVTTSINCLLSFEVKEIVE